MIKHAVLGLAAFVTLAPTVSAHHEAGVGSGLAQGLLHPLTGVDHLLAALAVGLWASQRGGRSLFVLPLAFVTMLVAGGMLGQASVATPLVEYGIVFSVLALGLFVAAAANPSTTITAAVIGLFAICHGFAHGAETPNLAAPASWTVGFAASTIALLCSGIALGYIARTTNRANLIRIAGGSIAAAGVVLLFV